MIKRSKHITLLRYQFILVTLLIALVSCQESKKEKITIATAASMQYVIKKMAADFSAKTDIECVIIIGSSGKLTAQIIEGAPYHILLSADMKYPQFIHSKGLTRHLPEIFGYGKLVLWTADISVEPRLDRLTDPSVDKIAIANPKTAPYGEITLELLNKYGITDSVRNKLVYGESIAQTNQFISTQAVTLGFTSLSSVLADPMKDLGNWISLPEKDYRPIPQGAVIINRGSEQNKSVEKFYTYLFSEEAGQILEEFGYSRNE